MDLIILFEISISYVVALLLVEGEEGRMRFVSIILKLSQDGACLSDWSRMQDHIMGTNRAYEFCLVLLIDLTARCTG